MRWPGSALLGGRDDHGDDMNNMTWQEARDIVIARQKNPRWNYLCSDECPEHVIRRVQVLKIAGAPALEIPPVQSERTVISTSNGGIQAVPTQDAMQLNKEIRECPHYNKISNCGCGRARCMIGKGGEIDLQTNNGTSLVSFWDCAACLRPGVEIYEKYKHKVL
jgi:hypothetical protein